MMQKAPVMTVNVSSMAKKAAPLRVTNLIDDAKSVSVEGRKCHR
jgi:hypothetical protein